ncbi:Gfo/Idh/MocA family oxidoreductase [Planomicrobium okeanokoites]|uniref:Gfo/Idh/MocA family protein n=1 Tax=Planomicrobium okeanokoites TaxID=244 RepID=UPI0030F93691
MRLATIGTNWITSLFIEAVEETAGIELAAVYSRSQQKAEAFAEQHSAPLIFTNLETMAESEEIDCVYIASPNSLHFAQTILFLENKKHVICEKPIFSNAAEFEAAHQKAEENGVFLFEALRGIHTPNFKELKEQLNSIGKVRNVLLHRNKYSSRYGDVLKGEVPNIFSLQYSGGTLVDLGVYPLSIAVALFGKPDKSSYSAALLSTGVDGSGSLVLEYPEFVCTILCSKISTSYNGSEIQGEQGTIQIDDTGSLAEINLIDNQSGERHAIGEIQSAKNMKYEIAAFLQIIGNADWAEYGKLTQISREILEITEAARKQNGIFYPSDKEEMR